MSTSPAPQTPMDGDLLLKTCKRLRDKVVIVMTTDRGPIKGILDDLSGTFKGHFWRRTFIPGELMLLFGSFGGGGFGERIPANTILSIEVAP